MAKQHIGTVKGKHPAPAAKALLTRGRQRQVIKTRRDKARNRRSKIAQRLKQQQLKGTD